MKKPLVEQMPIAARINVTPIIDVALVLVIILLITAPMIAVSDMPIALPSAKTRSTSSDARINVTLGLSGEVAVDEETINPAALRYIIANRIESDGEDIIIVVRADEGVPYANVEVLLREARAAGARRLAIATRQRQPGGNGK
jgi:biopolymer transport protein TolR